MLFELLDEAVVDVSVGFTPITEPNVEGRSTPPFFLPLLFSLPVPPLEAPLPFPLDTKSIAPGGGGGRKVPGGGIPVIGLVSIGASSLFTVGGGGGGEYRVVLLEFRIVAPEEEEFIADVVTTVVVLEAEGADGAAFLLVAADGLLMIWPVVETVVTFAC